MQLILYSIAKSAVSILNVNLLLLFVWTIFSIIAMNILMGKMYYCTDASVDTYEECTGTYIPVDEPPVGQTSGVRYGFGLHHKNIAHAKSDKAPRYLRVNKRYWVRHGSHFDNFYSSIVTLNEMSSFQEWPVVAWNAVDTVDEFHGPKLDNNLGYMVFFVLFIMISQYLFFNLFIGVIFTSFSEVKASKMGTHNMTRRQQSWLHVCQMIAQPSSRPIQIPPLPPDWPFRWVGTSRRFMYRFVLSKQVDYFISACIGANVVVLAMKQADETQERTEQLEFWNLIFSLIFIAEAVIKILAINFRTYWAGYWNRLDLVLVILSLLDLVVLEVLKADAEVRAFGALRVLRIFRLVRKSKQVKMLFEMIQQSWSYLMNSIFLYLLLLVMFSILAMNMFGDLERGRYLHDRAHFETFPTAMLTLFRAATSDDWNELSYGADGEDGNGDSSVKQIQSRLFFMVYHVSMGLIFMNILAAVFLENFDDIEMKSKYKVDTQTIRRFQFKWVERDPSGTGTMPIDKLPEFLRSIGPPLGFPARAQDNEILRLISSGALRAPDGGSKEQKKDPETKQRGSGKLEGDTQIVVPGGMVNYHDLLFALAWKVMGVKFDKGVKNQQVDRCLKTLHSRGMLSVRHPMREILRDRAKQRFSEKFAQRIATDERGSRKTPSPMQRLAAKALLSRNKQKQQDALRQMSFTQESGEIETAEEGKEGGGGLTRGRHGHSGVRDAETLERAYAGLVITKHYRRSKMAKRMGHDDIAPATLGLVRRQFDVKTVTDFLDTHVF